MSSLSEISIKRPVLASMMNIGLILFGIIGLTRLPVRELPDVDPPIINVNTVYSGASAAIVETEVSEILEESISSVEGIKILTSSSKEQISNITVEFELARDIDLAAQDVRDRVARVRGRLPDDIDEPIVSKQDADARPSMWVALYSEKYTTLELTQIAENVFKDRLQTVPGVSSILIGGSKRFAIRLWLDAEKMAAHQVTVLDIQRALEEQNVELPSGRVENTERELFIQTYAQLKSPEEYNNLIIRRDGDSLIRLHDIGSAEAGVENEHSRARYNTLPAVGMGIVRQSKSNSIAVAKGIKKEIERIRPLIPENINIAYAYDESIYIEKSIREVWITLAIAFCLVIISIYIFLQNLRATLIPTITIPVAITSTFGILYVFGYSINIVTMLAFILAIGLVVDDTIVVLENIYRHIEEGLTPLEAALKGMKEIFFAVVATTVALVAVFLPMAFQRSITGRLFIEFAIAISFAVIISTFVALTLAPSISARILRKIPKNRDIKFLDTFEQVLKNITEKYHLLLQKTLAHPFRVAVIIVAVLGLSVFFYKNLHKEFLPNEDKGSLFCLVLSPEGSTSEYTDRMTRKLEETITSTPEVKQFFSAVALARGGPGASSEGLAFVRLKEKRKRNVQDILAGPNGLSARLFRNVEGAIAFAIAPKSIGRGFGQTFRLVLEHQDLEKLNEYTQKISNILRGTGYLMNVRPSFQLTKPELYIDIDRDRAAALDISIKDLSRTLQILFGGLDLDRVNIDGKEYEVIAQLKRESRLRPQDLNKLYVRSKSDTLIQLSSIISYKTGGGPTAINHYNRYRSATIEATPVGVPIGTVASKVEAILKKELPDDFNYEWDGEIRDLNEAGKDTFFILILALLVIYIVLAAQFENLIHPLTIMLTIPLGAVGAFGALWLLANVNMLGIMFYGMAHYAPDPPAIGKLLSSIIPRIPSMGINLYSQIGMILLLGLVTKNAILLVDFANQNMREGKSAREAMLIAGRIRLRPILMTSVSTIAGMLPIAIGFGAGAESRRPLGVAAIGGIAVGTFLTLFVIPVIYVFFDKCSAKFKKTQTHAANGSQNQ